MSEPEFKCEKQIDLLCQWSEISHVSLSVNGHEQAHIKTYLTEQLICDHLIEISNSVWFFLFGVLM